MRFWDRGQRWSGLAGFASAAGSSFFGGFAAVTGIALSVDQLFVKNLVAEIDALITDVDPRTRDQFAHLLLGLSAERALQMGVKFGHRALDTSNGTTEPVGMGSDWIRRIVGKWAVSAPRNDSFASEVVHNAIDQSVFNRFCWRKEVVPFGVFSDFGERLAGMLRHQTIQGFLKK